MTAISVSAPGRICLFGEHQDFLGLPVVAAGIDRRVFIEGTPRTDSVLRVEMPDIGQVDEIDLSPRPVPYTIGRDYLRSCVNVLRRDEGLEIPGGFDCRMTSNIPIRAGVSSSSAMIVAWLRFLIETAGAGDSYSREQIARLAHRAEVVEFDEPGGMMDHFSCAMGGFVYVDCRPPFRAERLPLQLGGFILGDSLRKKQTIQVLSCSREDMEGGLRSLAEWYPGFDLHTTPKEELFPLLDRLPENVARKVRANLINRDLTVEAMKLFRGAVDPVRLGELLTLHHEQLRDGIGVSTPKIDAMLEAALGAGALGGKINGSGGGGCMFAYAPGREDAVVEAMERAGGKAYRLTIDSGARVDETE